ncbi:MAG: hypothetical protein QOF33_3711 [Thermomicrobiales bacterium]|jgi:hypothetical protein|nr:hypothetical protein [Thermomicrobiales bacterium]MEA2596720.1 hypothetical protein [Thermomicrobiales bacterium]
MSDPDVQREVEANEERTARGDETDRDNGILCTIGQAFDGILSPLRRGSDSAEEIEARRRANDAEERG